MYAPPVQRLITEFGKLPGIGQRTAQRLAFHVLRSSPEDANALADTMSTLPAQLARSLTWDRGKEMSAHAQFKIETGIPVFFADPQTPWQRGTNENTNGLLRQYFPKGTDISRWSAEELEAVAHALNTRPRKTLGWKTPAEAFNEQLRSLQQAGVASTG